VDVLLTWVGSRDPYWTNRRTGKANDPGPILSLLKRRRFGAVYLLFNLESSQDDFRRRASQVLRYCQRYFPAVAVKQRPVELVSVVDYQEIFRVVNHEWQAIVKERGADHDYYVYLSPGTPQMQTVWVLLVQSGLLPATMIDATPEDLLGPGKPAWRVVDLSLPGFPQVVNPGETARVLGILERQNANLAAENRRLRAELRLREAGARAPVDGAIGPGFRLSEYLRAQEQALYARALEQAKNNASGAARLLGVEPHTFRAGAERLGVRPRRRKRARSLGAPG
jgi:hypothetical protein